MKTGLEILKNPGTTAGEIADILGKGHPPFEPGTKVDCSHVTCRECWPGLADHRRSTEREGGVTMEKKHLIEEALKKFASLDDEAKEFALGYVTGKHDEKQIAK